MTCSIMEELNTTKNMFDVFKPQDLDISSMKPNNVSLEAGKKLTLKAVQNMLSCLKWLRTLLLEFLA